MGDRFDDLLVNTVGKAFRIGFLIAGALALIGAAFLLVRARLTAALGAAAAAAIAVPAGYALAHHEVAPKPVVIADPCHPPANPGGGGILTGLIQGQIFNVLNSTACKNGSSREELVLAILEPKEAEAYKRKYGVDPRSTGGIVQLAQQLLG